MSKVFIVQTPRQSVREVPNGSSLQPSYCTETKWDNRAAFATHAKARAYARKLLSDHWRIKAVPAVGELSTAVRHAEGINF